MLVDMHLHECTYSTDSFLHLEEIVSIARQKGLDAICITDHDSMGLRERAEAYSREIGYPIFVGVEFFSLWGDITAWGIDGIPDQRVSAQDFRKGRLLRLLPPLSQQQSRAARAPARCARS